MIGACEALGTGFIVSGMKKISVLPVLVFGCLVILVSAVSAQLPGSLTNGLQAYYPLAGHTLDTSGNGYNATNSGAIATTNRFGREGSALSFNGAQVVTAPGLLPSFHKGATLSSWINSISLSDKEQAAVCKAGASGDQKLRIGVFEGFQTIPSGVPDAGFNSYSNNIVLVSDNPIQGAGWHHLVVTLDGSKMIFYLDGAEVDRASYTNYVDVQSSNPIYIGNEGVRVGYFIGSISDVGIWNRALSSNEVVQLFAADPGGPEPLVKICAPTNTPLRVGLGLSNITNFTASNLPSGWNFDATLGQIFGRMTGTNPITSTLVGQQGSNSAVSVPITLIPQLSQRIAFTVRGSAKVGDILTLLTSSTSQLPVTVTSSDTNILRINGSTANAFGKGRVTLTAIQDGNEQFAPATPIKKTVIVR